MNRRYRLDYRDRPGEPWQYFATYSNFEHALVRLRERSYGGRIIDRRTGRIVRAYSGFHTLRAVGLPWWSDGPSFGAGQVVTSDR